MSNQKCSCGGDIKWEEQFGFQRKGMWKGTCKKCRNTYHSDGVFTRTR